MEATLSACRLLHLLYDQLKAFSSLTAEQAGELAWEKVLAAEAITTGLTGEPLRNLRVAVHSAMCAAFTPLRKRMGALFRGHGKCTLAAKFYGKTGAASLTAALSTSSGSVKTMTEMSSSSELLSPAGAHALTATTSPARASRLRCCHWASAASSRFAHARTHVLRLSGSTVRHVFSFLSACCRLGGELPSVRHPRFAARNG